MKKLAAAILLTAALSSCMSSGSIESMDRYAKHFDAFTPFMLLCVEDHLLGAFDGVDPYGHWITDADPPGGWYSATVSGRDLVLRASRENINGEYVDVEQRILLSAKTAEWLLKTMRGETWPIYVYYERRN